MNRTPTTLALLLLLTIGVVTWSTLAPAPPVDRHAVADFVPLRSFGDHAWSVAFSPDGRSVLTGGFGGAQLWDASQGQLAKSLVPLGTDSTEGANRVAFSSDGRSALVGFKGGPTYRWHFASDTRDAADVPLRGGETAHSPDGLLVARAEGARIHLYTVPGDERIASLEHVGGIVSRVQFSPDGQVLASASAGRPDGARDVRLWDVATGTEIRRLPWDGGYVWDVAFRPDGRALAVGGEGGIALWGIPR